MLGMMLHSVVLPNIHIPANRLIPSVFPVSTKWDHTDIREKLYTEVGEGNSSIEKLSCSVRSLHSTVEDDNFLALKTTDLMF